MEVVERWRLRVKREVHSAWPAVELEVERARDRKISEDRRVGLVMGLRKRYARSPLEQRQRSWTATSAALRSPFPHDECDVVSRLPSGFLSGT